MMILESTKASSLIKLLTKPATEFSRRVGSGEVDAHDDDDDDEWYAPTTSKTMRCGDDDDDDDDG